MAPELSSRELECFLVLAEELHFGRTADRLRVSQSRVSQLLRALERRVGTSLVHRTSRTVALTPAGAAFRARLGPAYTAVRAAVETTRREAEQAMPVLRLGFQGSVHEPVTRSIRQFERLDGRPRVEVRELPLGDPFSDVRAGRVDMAVVLRPIREPDLRTGAVFSRQEQTVALARGHRWADLGSLAAERLADIPMIVIDGPAPGYWHEAQNPSTTPDGAPLRPHGRAATLQEGLSRVAAGHVGMLLCAATADHNTRGDVRFVPVEGLPHSELALVWRRDREDQHVAEFGRIVDELVAAGPGAGQA